MNNLILIGNGFDLAHGLKTSYSHFIEYLIREKNKDYLNVKFTKLINGALREPFDRIKINPREFQNYFHRNGLFQMLVIECLDKNWVDIEKRYFKELSESNAYKDNIKLLNTHFEDIKEELENYLFEEQKNVKRIDCYQRFFTQLDTNNTLILNFNYTSTIKQYPITRSQIINIHGELKNDLNPIIFGYAANEEEQEDLRGYDDNEYFKNIKKYWYNKTTNDLKLRNYLNNTPSINLHILGHSIGLSDKLILNQIFNHKNVSSFRICYYKNHDCYFNKHVNIFNIMKDVSREELLKKYPECIHMPQWDDAKELNEKFVNYVNKLVEEQGREKNNQSAVYNIPLVAE